MTPTEPGTPNAEHIDVWNQILVPKFRRFQRIVVEGLGAHGPRALASTDYRAGDRVLDVGCGFGDTTIAIAARLGPTGLAVGVDCCQGFIEDSAAAARRTGVTNVRFQVADAQSEAFTPAFDHVFSRLGTMFFQNPVAAMKNLGRALAPGGDLTMVVWRAKVDNEWAMLPTGIALAHLPPPDDAAPSCGPGPFSMADPDTVRAILDAAGFVDATLTQSDRDIFVGDSVAQAIAFQLAIGPAGEIVREAKELGEARRPEIEAELGAALATYRKDGGYFLPSSTWIVTAKRPG